MKRTRIVLILSLVLCGLAPRLAAADTFRSLPAEKAGQSTPLEVRVVHYDGNSNGVITVDVKNPTAKPQEFSAKGLYFVPQGNADQAPQRVGAVGPFQIQRPQGPERRERLTIAPGATERLTLDVYCIDSHRASPGPGTGFRIAKDRVPPPLVRAIDADSARAAAAYGGVSAPAAKSAVQSEVWRNRDKKWIELDGEGKQEAAKH
jgi:hypothetical protein